MLNAFFSKFPYIRLFNLGFLLDFFIKKIFELIIKNVLIYLSQFFAEKFLIEFFSKKLIELIIFNLNKNINLFYFQSTSFFFNVVIFLTVTISILNCFFLLF